VSAPSARAGLALARATRSLERLSRLYGPSWPVLAWDQSRGFDGEYRAGRPGLTLRAATAAALADELEKWERATPSRRRPALPPHGQAVLLPSEVAALFRVDRVTVTRWAAGRKLPSFRTPAGHRRFRASQVLPLLEFPPDGAAVSAAAGGRPWCAWCITGSSDDDCTCTSNCGESRCPR